MDLRSDLEAIIMQQLLALLTLSALLLELKQYIDSNKQRQSWMHRMRSLVNLHGEQNNINFVKNPVLDGLLCALKHIGKKGNPGCIKIWSLQRGGL